MLDVQAWTPQPGPDDIATGVSLVGNEIAPAEAIAPLLDRAAVWIDPPAELGDDVVDSVVSELY